MKKTTKTLDRAANHRTEIQDTVSAFAWMHWEKSLYSVLWAVLEPGTFKIRSRNANCEESAPSYFASKIWKVGTKTLRSEMNDVCSKIRAVGRMRREAKGKDLSSLTGSDARGRDVT
jgi:hypothetical protein